MSDFSDMSDTDQYRRRMEFCRTNAGKAPFSELREVWQTLGDSYAFLAELEAWPGFVRGQGRNGSEPPEGIGNADVTQSPPPAPIHAPPNKRSYSSLMIP
ncbi:MAG TPA: hypothetical protein VKX28_27440 [Xanthobacteraceae bacterium]|nr:hypothetical protein [Xanthobacteraceae bacterium]